jgi:hypothetical protein
MLGAQRLNDSEEHPPYLIAWKRSFAKPLNISGSQFPGNGQPGLQFKT